MDLADIKRRHGRDWSSLQRMHGTDGAQRECPLILRDRGQLIAEVERLTVALSDTQERYTAVAVAEKKIAEKAEADVARLTALCDGYRGEVEELKRWDTLVCPRCHGIGEITAISGQTPESYSQENIPCPDCVGPIIDERDAAVSALTRARAEALEEAAKIADEIPTPGFASDSKSDGYWQAMEDIAAAIRACAAKGEKQ